MTEREKKRCQRRKRILDAYADTGSIKATRRKTGHSINLIRKVLRSQDQRRRPPSSQPKRKSKLDPYRPLLHRLIVEDELTAVLAFEELRELGFDGGYTIVKEAVRVIRPSPKKKATTRVEHKPGAEGQVDWSPHRVFFSGVSAVAQCFSLVLPFSSWIFMRYALNQQLETLIRLHEQAFNRLGTVPSEMTYDNVTTVGRHVGPGKVWLNPRFEAWAGSYGFDIVLTRPGRPNDHAPVERHFHYVENNCLKRRRSRFEDLDDLNRHAEWWCDNVANVRQHGTTRQRPVDRLRIERTYMLPLPGNRPEAFQTLSRKVQTDYCVAVDTNRYSVSPRHVGRPATVHLFSERLEILVDGEVVAVHARSEERCGRHVLPEHEEEFKRHTPSRRLLEQAFLRLGEAAEPFYEGLKVRRGRGAGYHMKRLLNLADRHGTNAVVAAMAQVTRYGAFSADAVARVLQGVVAARSATPKGEIPMPPERIRAWLEGLDVDGRDLSTYDDMIDELDGDEEDDDGE
jgi:transposase